MDGLGHLPFNKHYRLKYDIVLLKGFQFTFCWDTSSISTSKWLNTMNFSFPSLNQNLLNFSGPFDQVLFVLFPRGFGISYLFNNNKTFHCSFRLLNFCTHSVRISGLTAVIVRKQNNLYHIFPKAFRESIYSM